MKKRMMTMTMKAIMIKRMKMNTTIMTGEDKVETRE